MKDLSITQEYLLCAMNNKGGFPLIGKEQPVCFVAGALWELISNNFVHIQNKRIVIVREIEESFNYLSPMFELIQNSKPKTIKNLVGEYVFSLTEKDLKALIHSVAKSLVLAGYAKDVCNKGFLGRTNRYIVPRKDKTENVIQKIRAELLEDGTVSEETVGLASLLNKSGLLKQYFSKYESQQLKVRLNEIKNSDQNQMVKEMLQYVDSIMTAIIVASVIPK